MFVYFTWITARLESRSGQGIHSSYDKSQSVTSFRKCVSTLLEKRNVKNQGKVKAFTPATTSLSQLLVFVRILRDKEEKPAKPYMNNIKFQKAIYLLQKLETRTEKNFDVVFSSPMTAVTALLCSSVSWPLRTSMTSFL